MHVNNDVNDVNDVNDMFIHVKFLTTHQQFLNYSINLLNHKFLCLLHP